MDFKESLFPPLIDSTNRVEAAICLAAAVHAGQSDASGEPYIFHPLRVMAEMQTEPYRVVAVLHDVLKASPGFRNSLANRISAMFGDAVREEVEALTLLDGEDYLNAYIPRVKDRPLATKVKSADLLDNLAPTRARHYSPRQLSAYDRAYAALRGRNLLNPIEVPA